ncbi:uncharacterized protein LOC141632562 [Silene latifolia]|uniref:uncharacterized protein LOC141632562 n=1 Tax=Silene latifolia TaxID=37657 RepID=UPI003D781BE3
MIPYLKVATEQKLKFRSFKISQVPRDQNMEADALATLGATFQPTELSNIPIIHVLTPAIQKEVERNQAGEATHVQHVNRVGILVLDENQQVGSDWRKPYMEWLKDGKLPEDKKEAQSFRIKASRFDVHSGECGNHAGGQSLSNKILRQGYFWPTMRADAVNHAKRCDSCQKAAQAIHQPAEPMHPIISKWPFMMWGMYIVGKLPRAPGNRVYMLVMTDYFLSWIEAEAMTEVKEAQVISFIKRNIISRFGIPSEIVCDNGSEFISDNTEGFCSRWNITLRKSAPRYPQTNSQAESSNKITVENLRKQLEELRIWLPNSRDESQIEMTRSLDTVDELRESAYIRMASYKQSVARMYNKNVNVRTLAVGDLVLIRVFENTKNHKTRKFAYKWEGPYQVESIVKNGAYGLMTMQGKKALSTNVGYLSDKVYFEGPAPAMWATRRC